MTSVTITATSMGRPPATSDGQSAAELQSDPGEFGRSGLHRLAGPNLECGYRIHGREYGLGFGSAIANTVDDTLYQTRALWGIHVHASRCRRAAIR